VLICFKSFSLSVEIIKGDLKCRNHVQKKDVTNFGAMLSTDWCNALRPSVESIYSDNCGVVLLVARGPDLARRTNPSGLLKEIGHSVHATKVALTIRHLHLHPNNIQHKVRGCCFHSGQKK